LAVENKAGEHDLAGSGTNLAEILAMLQRQEGANDPERAGPPVEKWNPGHCGDIDMVIRKDGSWWHEGTRISREKMVRLFSTILRKDADGLTYLVTPVEKVIVHVEDAPFLAVRVDRSEGPAGQVLSFMTNVGDLVLAGPHHPIRVTTDPETGEPSPYLLVRGRLEAKLTRPAFYELVSMGEARDQEWGVVSEGAFFALGPCSSDQAETG
jgi:uncharacterized protein